MQKRSVRAISASRLSHLLIRMSLLILIGFVAVSCGGDDDEDPTPAPPAPTTAPPAAPTEAASPAAAPAATPVSGGATPEASPVVSASPVASAGVQSITREAFQAQLLQKFAMEEPANKGGRVILGESGDISTVNPILANDSLTLYVAGSIYETLIGASPIDGQPVPALADSWEVSPDGLVYTFHLNQDAKWHDGVDVTAEDVKFSFDSVLDPNTGSFYTTSVNEAVASYRVVDADTFEITARDRLVNFLYDGPGAVFIMPRHVWESVGTESWSFDGGSTGQDPSRVIGSGPFKFKEWVQGDHATIVRNDAYYDVIPTIDEFILQVQPNADTAVLALENKSTDIMEIIPPAQTEEVQNTAGLQVDIYDFFQFTFYGFNIDPAESPYFVDKRVRQALFYALDRESITQEIFLGYGEAATGTQPPASPAYAPDRMQPAYTFDPERAKQLLAEAGWEDTDGNGTVDKDGEEFTFELITYENDAVLNQIVSYMKDAWEEVGVEMEISFMALSAVVERLENHDFDATFLAFNLGIDGSQGLLFSCDAYDSAFNFWGFCNERWDELDELQKREFDPAQRTEYLIEQSQTIWDEQPVGVIRFGVARTGYNTRIHNFYPNGYGFLWSLPYIWVDA